MEPAELLASTVDKSQVPPLHQKRIVAFVNHFLINSCSFLNEFAKKCETKFIELERKMQRVEVALAVIEAKLASIPEETPVENTTANSTEISIQSTETTEIEQQAPTKENTETDASPTPTTAEPAEQAVRACEDVRYKKYFKMLQYGVTPGNVKMKMQMEGFDPNILNTPNLELSDGVRS